MAFFLKRLRSFFRRKPGSRKNGTSGNRAILKTFFPKFSRFPAFKLTIEHRKLSQPTNNMRPNILIAFLFVLGIHVAVAMLPRHPAKPAPGVEDPPSVTITIPPPPPPEG